MASTSKEKPSIFQETKENAKIQDSSLVEQFCAFTDANEVRAQQMLEACNGNLEMAINMYVDSEAAPATAPEEAVRAPFPPVQAVLVTEDKYGFGFRGSKRGTQSVFDGFRDFQAETKWQEEELGGMSSAAYKKRKTLEDLFRPPLDLLHRGSFDSARDAGQARNRWLMINIQNGKEFACQVLNRDVWSNAAVKSIVAEHFVFWQVYFDSEEGERYVQFYKVSEYPYIAILDPRTGEKLVVWNKMDSVSFCDLVTEFLSRHPTPDGSQPSPCKSHRTAIVDESEDQQMREAIRASLESHDNNHPSPEGREDDSDLGECSNDELDSAEESTAPSYCKASTAAHRILRWQDYLGSETEPKSELVIRFPDGERRQMVFPCTSQLQALLLYVESQGFSAEEYELVTNFPRRQMSCFPNCSSLRDVGLFPRETIFVQLKNTT